MKQNGDALHWASEELQDDPLLRSWVGLTRKQRLLRIWREHVVLLCVTYHWQLAVAKRQEQKRIANAELGVVEDWAAEIRHKRARSDVTC